MKFWLPLILGTIGVSAFLTYLNLYKGAQTLSFPPVATKSAVFGRLDIGAGVSLKGKPAPHVEQLANVVEVDGGVSYVGERSDAAITIRNTGQGPLELSLLEKSCTCANIFVDDKEVTPTDHVVTLAPGKSAILRMSWKPEVRNSGEHSRIRARFEHNDPRYNDNFIFEIVSNIKIPR
jgi:hypothetical protein